MRKIYFYQLVHKYELFMCNNDREKMARRADIKKCVLKRFIINICNICM